MGSAEPVLQIPRVFPRTAAEPNYGPLIYKRALPSPPLPTPLRFPMGSFEGQAERMGHSAILHFATPRTFSTSWNVCATRGHLKRPRLLILHKAEGTLGILEAKSMQRPDTAPTSYFPGWGIRPEPSRAIYRRAWRACCRCPPRASRYCGRAFGFHRYQPSGGR